MTISLLLHAAALIVFTIASRSAAVPSTIASKPVVSTRLVWTAAGPGASDDGGGRRAAAPEPAPTRFVRAQSVARPAEKPRPAEATDAKRAVSFEPAITVPDQVVATGLTEVVGTVSEVRPTFVDPRGAGSGDRPHRGRDTGDGDNPGLNGNRVGIGPGDGEIPGGGVSSPVLLLNVRPNYTSEAMRRQIEGLVELEIVVLPDGSVGRIQLVRSLDSRFGLDEEAIAAVRRWRFDPGRRMGKAIPTRVSVEMAFNLR